MEKPRPEPRPAPSETAAVPEVGLNRCPYCHEGVVVGEERSFACEGCLARHHPACWRERGACAACGGEAHMVPAPAPARAGRRDAEPGARAERRPSPARERRASGIGVLVVSAVTLPALLVGGLAAYRASGEVVVEDHRAALEQALELKEQGLNAYEAWSRARAAESPAARVRGFRQEAIDKLQAAMEALNEVLSRPAYRGADGFLKPEYEGYEAEMREIATHLVDLEKSRH